jgi:hypothetical protein
MSERMVGRLGLGSHEGVKEIVYTTGSPEINANPDGPVVFAANWEMSPTAWAGCHRLVDTLIAFSKRSVVIV